MLVPNKILFLPRFLKMIILKLPRKINFKSQNDQINQNNILFVYKKIRKVSLKSFEKNSVIKLFSCVEEFLLNFKLEEKIK